MAESKESSYVSFFSKMVNRFFTSIPKVKAQEEPEAEEEEDLVDPMDTIRGNCNTKPQLKTLLEKYEACNARVSSKTKTAETCEEELFDYIHELDHCVAHSLWSKLR